MTEQERSELELNDQEIDLDLDDIMKEFAAEEERPIQETSAQALLEAYRAVLTEETCIEKLAEILQQPAQYTSELISYTTPTIGADVITFTVKCADAQTAAALADAVKAHLEQCQAQISRDVSAHKLSVLKSTALATADSALAEAQRGEINRLSEILTGLTEARNKKSALVSAFL